jgi:hypothetical protein
MRVLYDPVGRFHGHSHARGDQRITSGTWPIGILSNALEAVVSQLGQPVVRLFTIDFVISPQWVNGQRKRWRG